MDFSKLLLIISFAFFFFTHKKYQQKNYLEKPESVTLLSKTKKMDNLARSEKVHAQNHHTVTQLE